jgi:hypothetical protein
LNRESLTRDYLEALGAAGYSPCFRKGERLVPGRDHTTLRTAAAGKGRWVEVKL